MYEHDNIHTSIATENNDRESGLGNLRMQGRLELKDDEAGGEGLVLGSILLGERGLLVEGVLGRGSEKLLAVLHIQGQQNSHTLVLRLVLASLVLLARQRALENDEHDPEHAQENADATS